MGFLDFIKRLFTSPPRVPRFQPRPLPPADVGHGVDELARRLGVGVGQLRATRIAYTQFHIPKRTGGTRTILAPTAELKMLQRSILRRLLARLRVHPAAVGFER